LQETNSLVCALALPTNTTEAAGYSLDFAPAQYVRLRVRARDC
jgi:hypothetical protein